MIIKDCGTVFTQIREHLGKTKGELADELGLGKHGERLIERIEQNKEDIQPATLRKLLDLLSGDDLWVWHIGDARRKLLLEQVEGFKNDAEQRYKQRKQRDKNVEDLKSKHKKRLIILYTIFTASVALTIVNTVVFFT